MKSVYCAVRTGLESIKTGGFSTGGRVTIRNKAVPVHILPQNVSRNQTCCRLYVLIRRDVEGFKKLIKFVSPMFLQCRKRYVIKHRNQSMFVTFHANLQI